jgi:hypothetical protein
MNKPPTLWDVMMDEMPRHRRERTWGGFAGAVAGAVLAAPVLAVGAVAREIIRANPGNADVTAILNSLGADTGALHVQACHVAATINFPDTDQFSSAVLRDLIARLRSEHRRAPAKPILAAFLEIIDALYDLRELAIPPEKPADILLHTIAGARWRDATRYYIAQFSSPELLLQLTQATFVEAFYDLTCALPPIATTPWEILNLDEDQGEMVPTVPLLEICDPRPLINAILLPFFYPQNIEHNLFVRVRSFIEQRVEEVRCMPQDFRGSSHDAVQAYLSSTVFTELFDSGIPFEIPQETRFSGHWIIAPPGRGKTTLLHSMFLEDLQRDASIIVMDSKGDLINPLKELKAVQDRLVLVEPDAEFPLALNPLDIPHTDVGHTIALIEYVFSSLLEAKFTPLQMTLFRNVLPAVVEGIPNPTLAHFRDVIENGIGKYSDQIGRLDPDVQAFFATQFNSKTYAETRNQIIWRLDFLRTNKLMRAMFDAPKTKLDIGKEMDAGKIILINNSKALLGEDGAEFFGRFFVALVLSAAQQRSGRQPHEKLPCFFYIDECHNVIKRDEKIPTILDECRSQKIALIMAHQRTEQIISKDVLSALSNCAIRMANSDEEAKQLAPDLRTTPDFLQSLPVGKFAAYIRDYTTKAIALQIPYHDMRGLPRMSAAEQQILRDRMRSQYSNSKTTLRPVTPPATPTTTPPLADPDHGDAGEPATKW